jgi:hypothetical protein
MKLTQPSLSSPSTPVVSALALAASSELGLVRSGLVAEYRFNEGSGQILYDYSGNNNHGTLGSTTGADTNDPTYTGQGASFETDDYIVCGAVKDGIGATQYAYTMSAVFYVGTAITKASTYSTLMSFKNSPTAADYACLYFGVITAALVDEIITLSDAVSSDVNYTYWGDTSASISIGWHTVSIRWTGAYYDIILDGVKKTVTHESGAVRLIPLSRLSLGGRYYGGAYSGNQFNGGLAHVGVWNRSLTDAELSQNYAYLKSYLLRERGITI